MRATVMVGGEENLEQPLWLDAFKQSAPDNALANYLWAHNYYKAGQTDQAVQELVAETVA